MDPQAKAQLFRDLIDLGKITLPALIAVVAALLSAWLAFRFGLRRERQLAKRAFKERQIREFYSPMVALLQSIRARSELREEISNLAAEAWAEVSRGQPTAASDMPDQFEPFHKLIEYDKRQLREELVPTYERMLSVFTENFWLSEPSTQAHYAEFSRYVEIWRRDLHTPLPGGVAERIQHRESRLYPFYDELRAQFGNLRSQLSEGAV